MNTRTIIVCKTCFRQNDHVGVQPICEVVRSYDNADLRKGLTIWLVAIILEV